MPVFGQGVRSVLEQTYALSAAIQKSFSNLLNSLASVLQSDDIENAVESWVEPGVTDDK